ncbi:MAG TPA: hypothetical protein VF209_03865 [Patescibacteria group bacterium]
MIPFRRPEQPSITIDLDEVVKKLYFERNLFLFLDEVIRLTPLELSSEIFDEVECIRRQLEEIKDEYLSNFQLYQIELWCQVVELDQDELEILAQVTRLVQNAGLSVKVLSLIQSGFTSHYLL